MIKLVLSLCLLITLFSNVHAGQMRISTYNIRNFDYDSRANIHTDLPTLEQTLRSLQADIIAVQEIVNVPTFNRFIQTKFPHYRVALSPCGGAGNQKLGFIYNTNKVRLIDFYYDARLSNDQENCKTGLRPASVASFKHIQSNIQFTAVALHLKAGGRPKHIKARYEQLQLVRTMIQEFRNQGQNNIVLLGDFNTTEFIKYGETYQRFRNQFIHPARLLDFSENVMCTAYWYGGQNDGIEHPSLLDHIVISHEMFELFYNYQVQIDSHCKVLACNATRQEDLGISYQKVSDHCPMTVTLSY